MLSIKKTTSLGMFLKNVLIYLEQRFCRRGVSSCGKCAIHLFPKQNKVFAQHLVDLVVLNFYFDLVAPFYFLK